MNTTFITTSHNQNSGISMFIKVYMAKYYVFHALLTLPYPLPYFRPLKTSLIKLEKSATPWVGVGVPLAQPKPSLN